MGLLLQNYLEEYDGPANLNHFALLWKLESQSFFFDKSPKVRFAVKEYQIFSQELNSGMFPRHARVLASNHWVVVPSEFNHFRDPL